MIFMKKKQTRLHFEGLLQKKKLPIVILDEQWHALFPKGKPSIIVSLEKKLNDENGSTLWFPTWQFAVLGEQDRLLIDLLMLLCCKLEEKCSKFDNDKDKETLNKVTRFIKRVGRAAALRGRLTKQMPCIAIFSQKGFLEMPSK